LNSELRTEEELRTQNSELRSVTDSEVLQTENGEIQKEGMENTSAIPPSASLRTSKASSTSSISSEWRIENAEITNEGIENGEASNEQTNHQGELTNQQESEVNSASIPSLAELKAMLMACESLAQLNALKKQHGKGIKDAYASLNTSQQLKIDGIEATAVSHSIYKYTGSLIEANGQSLKPGMLVYIDPKLGNQNANIVPVWLMRGLELGWQQAVLVSKDCLRLIEKAISNDDFLPFST
jgi:hypothetical protein